MFLFNLQTKNTTVRFERDIITNKINVDKISFIKAVRDATHCGLKDAKDFSDMMLNQLNKLQLTPESVRRDIQNEIINIDSNEDLIDILRFVRTVKDHNRPHMGTFDENGNYNPKGL